jgi:uncharacterized protein (TIGR03067 family)
MKRYTPLAILVVLLVAAAPPGAARRSHNLDGDWTMVRGEQDGKPLPDDVVQNSRLTIHGNQHTVKVGDTTMAGTHVLHQTTNPKHIDARDTTGPFKGTTAHGIYQLQGDEATFCFASPGKPRPTKFSSHSPDGGHFVHVWKRAE